MDDELRRYLRLLVTLVAVDVLLTLGRVAGLGANAILTVVVLLVATGLVAAPVVAVTRRG
ncbi:MAG: hypothetical protein ABEJ79_01595 [Halolamina sp.]